MIARHHSVSRGASPASSCRAILGRSLRRVVVALVAVGLGLAGASSLSAAVVFSASHAAPGVDVFESFDLGVGNFNSGLTRSTNGTLYEPHLRHRDLGQSFLVDEPHAMRLDRLTVRAGYLGTGTGLLDATYHLEIWRMADSADHRGDTLVSSQVGRFPSIPADLGGDPIHGVLWTFDLSDMVLEAGGHYGFLLSVDEPAADRWTYLATRYGSEYVGGRQLSRVNGEWDFAHSADVFFYAQGTRVAVRFPNRGSSPNLIPIAARPLVARRRHFTAVIAVRDSTFRTSDRVFGDPRATRLGPLPRHPSRSVAQWGSYAAV